MYKVQYIYAYLHISQIYPHKKTEKTNKNSENWRLKMKQRKTITKLMRWYRQQTFAALGRPTHDCHNESTFLTP